LTKEEILKDNTGDQTNLIATTGENFIELSTFTGEIPRFDAGAFYCASQGTMSMNKK
jgi:hypothetical protein